MTAKTILALAQAHRREPTRQSYAAMAGAVRALVSERDALRAELATVKDSLIVKPMQDTPPADHAEQLLGMVRPQNCGTRHCSCIECVMTPAGVES